MQIITPFRKHHKTKMAAGKCLKRGCKNVRVPGSAICAEHKKQLVIDLKTYLQKA